MYHVNGKHNTTLSRAAFTAKISYSWNNVKKPLFWLLIHRIINFHSALLTLNAITTTSRKIVKQITIITNSKFLNINNVREGYVFQPLDIIL